MKSLFKLLNVGLLIPLFYLLPLRAHSQDCSTLSFTSAATESRCIATGSIKVTITGGSGNYNVKVEGPVTTAYTSSTTITGLSAGSYTVTVKDITFDCTASKFNVIVPGSYGEPRFLLSKTDVTCMNGTDGTITVNSQQFGRSPFSYSIVAPSPSGVGTTNITGTFSNLIAGEYAIQLKDSCGGQQTRRVTILNYQWWIDGVNISKVNCDTAKVTVSIKDSKGNTSGFNGFLYAIVRAPGDTIWSNTSTFRFYIGTRRSVKVVIKDPCGTMQVASWVDPNVPSVNATVTTNNLTCNTFDVHVSGQAHLTNPTYDLYDNNNVYLGSSASGDFTSLAYGNYCMKIKDNCYDTTITRCFSATRPVPAVGSTVDITNQACSTFTATVKGQVNLTNPTYELYNSSNVLIASNSTGIFTNVKYGYNCIKVKNTCYDTTIQRCFTVNAPKPSVSTKISTSNVGCTTYSAGVGSLTNLTNPQYCLYLKGSTTAISCNTTGKFNNLAYNIDYYITVNNDDCYDTLIRRDFIIKKPIPSIGAVAATLQTCNSYQANVGGQANLNNPQYCLYKNGVKLSCNTNGQFPGLSYDSTYCVWIQNNTACYDTLIKKCFTIPKPVPAVNAVVTVSNKSCKTVTATIKDTNMTSPKYVLYNASNVAIDSNNTGVFTTAPYGNNCIKVINTCYDTTITRCFTANRDVPAVGTVDISNKGCGSFTATVTGKVNLMNPIYEIYDPADHLVTTSSDGVFNNLAYGSYCVKVKDTCYDTTFVRCITVDPIPIDINVTAKESCTFGTTDISVVFASGNAPYEIRVLNPVGVLVTSTTSATSPVSITGLPPLSGGQQYMVIGIDNCNVKDTALVTPHPSILNKTKFVKSKCPSGVWANGATDIDIDATSNLGTVTPVIIRKNGVNTIINFTSNVGSTYKFVDLEPATYIIEYSVPVCTGKVYDTIDVVPYSFPGLQQSAAYQCENNNFSVGAVVTGGCAPFSYEIIGSTPALPSIISAGQASPVFTITNGVQYTLVRLRAVDACGNATLNDVNILPLANTVVYSNSNCYYDDITLTVDSIGNADYTWYKKTSAVDSVLLASSQSYTIPYLLPSDTGTYVCHISVNGGCLNRVSYFRLTGACGDLLPGKVKLTGKEITGTVQLNWEATNDQDVQEYYIERSDASNGRYAAIGKMTARQTGGRNLYAFTDETPLSGINYYRLRFAGKGGRSGYTNIVAVRTSVVSGISLYPNPVKKVLNIALSAKKPESYRLTLMTVSGQVLHERQVQNVQQTTIQYERGSNVRSGVYMLRITAMGSQEMFVYKVIFE
jgi:hypothetical protein